MRWKLLPVAVCALCLGFTAACGVSQSDMEKMWDQGVDTPQGHQQGMLPFVTKMGIAVCQLEEKYNAHNPADKLDENKRQCPGGTEGTPPPPYPPK